MTKLADAIHAAGADAVARALSADPAFAVFNLMWSESREIVPACDRMGLETTEAAVAWVGAVNQAIGRTSVFADLVEPSVSIQLAGMAKVEWATLHKAMHDTGLLSSDCMLHNSDAQYHLPTVEQWATIAATAPSKRRKWRSETLDCDDFVRIALGWLAGQGLGNTASAFAATRHFTGQSLTGGHAVVLVWDNNLTPWQWEPQTGAIHPASHPKLGGNFLSSRVEYARIFA